MVTRVQASTLGSAASLITLGLVVLLIVAASLCMTETGHHAGHDHGLTQHVCALMLVTVGAPLFVVILALGGEVAAAAPLALIAPPLAVLEPPPRRRSLSR